MNCISSYLIFIILAYSFTVIYYILKSAFKCAFIDKKSKVQIPIYFEPRQGDRIQIVKLKIINI